MRSVVIFVSAAFLAVCTAVPLVSRQERSVPATLLNYLRPWCCPKLVNETSLFRPIGRCQVQAAAITNFGDCVNLKNQGYWWFVGWGDGQYDTKCTTHLGPFDPPDHIYSGDYCRKGKTVCIGVWYCSSMDSVDGYCSYNADCCDYIKRCFEVY